jgi:hypothetical protein
VSRIVDAEPATMHFFRRSPDIADADLEVRRRKPVKATADNLRKAHALLAWLGLERAAPGTHPAKRAASRRG